LVVSCKELTLGKSEGRKKGSPRRERKAKEENAKTIKGKKNEKIGGGKKYRTLEDARTAI